MIAQGIVDGVTREKARLNYIKALNKGILKVMSKMGISTLQSYCGAQIFEAIGLEPGFVDRYFTWTASRIGGVGIDVIADEVKQRHSARSRRGCRRRTISTRAVSTAGGVTASCTSSTPKPCRSCSTRREPGSTRSIGVHARSSTTRAGPSARCAACSISSPKSHTRADR